MQPTKVNKLHYNGALFLKVLSILLVENVRNIYFQNPEKYCNYFYTMTNICEILYPDSVVLQRTI